TGWSVNFNGGTWHKLGFASGCSANQGITTGEDAEEVSYSDPGVYRVGVKVVDASGNVRYGVDSVVAIGETGLLASFSYSDNRCVGTLSGFNSDKSVGNIEGYSWDFDEDGLEDSDVANPSFQFTDPGSYEVSLQVISTIGCRHEANRTLHMYDEPPTPTFSIDGQLCSNSNLVFTNTTIAPGYPDDILNYHWLIDGDSISENGPLEVFTSSFGSKEVSLVGTIPGCETISTDILDIIEGLEPDFSYLNNCGTESTVQFIDETSGANIDSYQWDFGDGGVSDEPSPLYQFLNEGVFQILMTVSNSGGCTFEAERTINISDSPRVDFDFEPDEVNIPIDFNGIDLTIGSDSIVDWFWDFGNGFESNESNVQYAYTDAGQYIVNLTVETAQGCSEVISKSINVEEALCPQTTFENGNLEVCRHGNVEIVHTTYNGILFEWDYCVGDFDNEINQLQFTTNPVPGASGLSNITLIETEELWYGFLTDRNNHLLYRLEFRNGLLVSPQIINLGNVNGLLNGPERLEIVNENGSWIGLLVNSANSHLLRLDFSAGINSTPVIEDLGDLGVLNGPRGISINQDVEDYVAIVTNYDNELTLINFGGSITNTPESTDIIQTSTLPNGTGGITSVDIVKQCDSYYGLVTGWNTTRTYHLSFGSELFSLPTVVDITPSIGSVSQGGRVRFLEENGKYYGYILTWAGRLIKLDFKDTPGITTPSRTEAISLASANTTYSLDIVKSKDSEWIGWSVNFNGNIWHRIAFDNDCNASIGTSVGEQAVPVSYPEPGVYNIELKVTGEDGNITVSTTQVSVSEESSPDISIDVDDSRCLVNGNVFTSVSGSSEINSYSWDFNGDGVEDSDMANPTVSYDTLGGSGTYIVRLEVMSGGGCSNFVEKEFTIYAEPPSPDFEIGAENYCTGNEVTFINQTNESNYDPEIISYEWNIGGTIYTEKSPVLNFDVPGDYEASLVVNIPGCESEPIIDNFEIKESTPAGFSFSTGCEETPVNFVNEVINQNLTFSWDFGDGYISDAFEPSHLFPESGSYDVSLSVINDNGCENVLIKEVVIDAQPEVSFEHDLVCSNEEISFRDRTVVNSADVVAWEWYLNDGPTPYSTSQNTDITFNNPGENQITLTVFASNGCEGSATQVIDVNESPSVSFTTNNPCFGETHVFEDNTGHQAGLLKRTWQINGEVIDSDDPEMGQVFEAGQYEVTLIVEYENLCSGTTSQTINVLKPVEVDFMGEGSLCENDELRLTDNSIAINEEILSRSWFVDNQFVGNGKLAIADIEAGRHEVMLAIETETGCSYELVQSYDIEATPMVNFTPSNDYGVPPFSLKMTNATLNATEYTWYVDDLPVSNSISPTLQFESEGLKNVKLIASNESGCIDSTSFDIESILPIVDLGVETLQLQDNGNGKTILLSIVNRSNLPIETIEATISMEDEFEVSETILKRINPGNSQRVSLNTTIPASSRLGYLCVNLSSIYNVEDINAVNNEECINLEQAVIFEPAFPNPTSGRTSIRAIIPRAGNIKLTLLDMAGQIRKTLLLDNQPSGLSTFNVDLTESEAGTYFVIIEYEGGSHEARIIKK
ncbi:MAG: PKD domain-containing protein, partial [Marinoscillum sp.]